MSSGLVEAPGFNVHHPTRGCLKEGCRLNTTFSMMCDKSECQGLPDIARKVIACHLTQH